MNTKPAHKSKTLWGVVIAVLPQFLEAFGVIYPVFEEEMTSVVNALVTLVGAVLAIVGRWKATQHVTITGEKAS